MIDHLDIEVEWTAKRAVTVHVVIEPDLHRGDKSVQEFDEDELRFEPTFDYPEVLGSRPQLLSFLEDITRAEADGGGVEALCLELNVPKLLKLLHVVGPPPARIRVPLTPDG